jgi:CubicO group peptidase (beta-lactamase class C family)
MQMKKTIRRICMAFLCLTLVLLLILAISAAVFGPEYMRRILANGESKVSDYQFFPERLIAKSAKPYAYAYAIDDSFGDQQLSVEVGGGKMQTVSLSSAAADNGTTSLIVARNDVVVFEQYFNGSVRESVNTSFSSVKSIDSLLIGLAIQDGYIKSVRQPVSDFIPEWNDTVFSSITIEDLLLMRSNISYEEGFAWFTDDAKTYYMPDLRELVLYKTRADEKYHGQFHYNNYHPLLLGIILERSTGRNVADYFREKIWDKIGAEYDASWSLDSEATLFEKMESGLNFRSIDYLKIGSMLLNHGTFNGRNVINAGWIEESTIAPAPLASFDTDSAYLADRNVGYRYMWYSMENNQGGHDFFAAGKYGQYLYVSPENGVVIVRTGTDTGNVVFWPEVFQQIAKYAGSHV